MIHPTGRAALVTGTGIPVMTAAVLVAPETSLHVAVIELLLIATLPSMLLAPIEKAKSDAVPGGARGSGLVGAALSAHAKQAQRMAAPQAWAHATLCTGT